MPAYADLVHQTSTTVGAGNLTLDAVNGKRTFLAAFGPGGTNAFDYYVAHREAAEWERGTGHEASGALVRDTVLASSNANAAVAFSSGVKDVTNDQPAGKRADRISIADTPPAGAAHGDLWWESDTGVLFIYFNDGSSSQWIGISGPGGVNSAVGEAPNDGVVYARRNQGWVRSFVQLTKQQYNALSPPDPNVLYIIKN